MTKGSNAGPGRRVARAPGHAPLRHPVRRSNHPGSGPDAVARGNRRIALTRERILAAAFGLVGDGGLSGFTTRRLGESLGCEAMSVYHHFPNKQSLFDAMVEQAIAGIPEPPTDVDPIERLRFLGYEYRAMAHRCPGFFLQVAAHRLDMPAGVAFVQRMLGHFRAAVPDDRLAAQAFRIFGHYVIGAALDETCASAAQPSATPPATDVHVTREHSRLAGAAPHGVSPFRESTFDLGFEIMLNGIAELAAKVSAESRNAPKPVIHPKRSGHALE